MGDDEPRPRRFYLLPKIHKPRDKWPFEDMPPGRPIVADCGSESYRVAEYIDYYLNPLSTRHGSYVKDTWDFVAKIKALVIKEPVMLFSMDVTSLYTNIETERGLKAVRTCFHKYPTIDRPENTLIDLLRLSLTQNDFEFNGEFYLQIKGTAMGKKFAPAYADIYMAQWEEEALAKCPIKPIQYFRYLDDIWGLWGHTEADFQEFVDRLNSHHESIKLTFTLSEHKIDYLDVTVFKGADFQETGKLDLKVFFKSTDTHALLHKRSYHPKHTFRGIVKSQLLRFNRICTQKHDEVAARKVLFKTLRTRGYARSFLRNIVKQQTQADKHETERRPDQQKRIIPFVVPYSKYHAKVARKVKRIFHNKADQAWMGDNFVPLIAYERGKNLRDLLVHSKLQPLRDKNKTKERLPASLRTRQRGVFCRIPRNVPLNRSNCVYLITCRKCGMRYVGETSTSINTRMNSHRYNVRTNKKIKGHVTSHFFRHGVQNMRVTGLEHGAHWNKRDRLKKEWAWIKKLGTQFPRGLNIRHETTENEES
ncbi:MAG: GIY-YIG nuclease family protein [Plesiomonas sp.]|uniref:GIY-YIG nuclease family protein n=1 Tax=Plesiomonas sp. TaxID=2486279 RepID=UPI003F2E58A8